MSATLPAGTSPTGPRWKVVSSPRNCHDEFFSFVAKAEKTRCLPEEAGNYLFYNPRTDQLHLVDERGKQIFDLCDGRVIDDVVREGCALIGSDVSPAASQQVLDFLRALKNARPTHNALT